MSSKRNLKRKSKDDEIQQVKRQKINLEETIETLKQNLVSEAIASDGATKKDRDHATKAASFAKTLVEKEKTYKELCGIQEKLEVEYAALM